MTDRSDTLRDRLTALNGPSTADEAIAEVAAFLRSDKAQKVVAARIAQLVRDGMCVCGSCLADEIPAALADKVEGRGHDAHD